MKERGVKGVHRAASGTQHKPAQRSQVAHEMRLADKTADKCRT